MSSPRGAPAALAAVAVAAFAGGAWAGADCLPDLVSVNARTGQARTILSKSGGDGSIVDLSPQRDRVLINQGLRLVTATTSGHVVARLADGLGTIGTARWSPDGKLVAFAVHAVRAACGSSVELWVVQASGEGPRKLSDCANYPAWAPDSKHLVFVGNFSESTGGGDVSVIGVDGSGRRDLTALTSMSAPQLAWSPRGGRIAFTVGGAVEVVRADGTGRPAKLARAGSPAWRADGARLAVVRQERSNRYALDVLAPNLSASRLVDRGKGVSLPTWSRDGRLAYVKTPLARGKSGIYELKPGSAPRRVTKEPGDASYGGLFWTPASDRVLYLRCRT
jgi:Tol biopolymer transport system component